MMTLIFDILQNLTIRMILFPSQMIARQLVIQNLLTQETKILVWNHSNLEFDAANTITEFLLGLVLSIICSPL